MLTEAELHERRVLQTRRPLPVEPGNLDALIQLHLPLGHRDEDVAVTIDDDGLLVQLAGAPAVVHDYGGYAFGKR